MSGSARFWARAAAWPTGVARAIWWVASLSVLGLPAYAPAGERESETRTAQRLVDLARDHGLTRRGRQTEADVAHVRVLLEAAARLDAAQPEAWAWLYEMALLQGDEAAADAALEGWKTAAPADEHVFVRWLERGLARRQTLESRRDFLADQFARERNPRNLSAVHALLAQLALQQADPRTAQQHLIEAREICPECPETARAALELLAADTSGEGRLEVLLAALRAHPLSPAYSWGVATTLDELGYPVEAHPFYQHASELYERFNPGVAPPAEQLTLMSQNALARGARELSIGLARRATEPFAGSYIPAIYLAELYRDLENRVESDRLVRELQRVFGEVSDPSAIDPGVAAQVAWFHCVLDPQPQRALLFAERAAASPAVGGFGLRVLGWALALNERFDEALERLEPLAGRDPEAAYQLARVLQLRGDESAPRRILEQLEVVPVAGPTRTRLEQLASGADTLRPGAERRPLVRQVLAGFDATVLQFYRAPEQFLTPTLRPLDLGPLPGDPWRVEFTLHNQGPFPIALGADETVNPAFLVALSMEGDRPRDFPDLLTVELTGQRVVLPGQTLRVTRAVDVGAAAVVNRRTPQQLQRVEVRAVFDPVRAGDTWTPALAGLQPRAVSFNRTPANTTEEAWRARFATLTGEEDAPRFRVIDELAQLLGEHQRSELGELGYRAPIGPAAQVRRGLLAALRVRSWEVRAVTLVALADTGLDAEMVSAVEDCARHAHWVVRLTAVRLLGERRIASSAGVLREVAAGDADPLVRRFAALYQPAASAPAATKSP